MSNLNLYMDDSGTRHPDHNDRGVAKVGDWFALGGILVTDEEEVACRRLHSEFCARWNISEPLHSSDIRFKSEKFEWLKGLETKEQERFYSELGDFLVAVPVLGLACVIDRPGYNSRYHEKYGRQKWSLCKTAFSVMAERAAKRALAQGVRLRIMPERSDKRSDRWLKRYYSELRSGGMPFQDGGDRRYAPLSMEELKQTLYDFKPKFKSSPMIQIADLYLYPMCRSGYVNYRPMNELRDHRKLLDCVITAEEVPTLGIKYSCFENAAKL